MNGRDFAAAIEVLSERAKTERILADSPRIAGHMSHEEWKAAHAAYMDRALSCERAIKLLELHGEFGAPQELAA